MRRRRLLLALGLALLIVPSLEIAVIIAVGRLIGGWPTFGVLLVESALGAWLVQREGRRAWQALAQTLASGRMPIGELADGMLILIGGTLLLTPGFITDLLGFALVIPFTRPISRVIVIRLIAPRLTRPTPGSGGSGQRRRPTDEVIEGVVIEPTDKP